MIDFKTLNQVFLVILATMLASLFVGSLLMNHGAGRTETTKFWRLSLGARAASYFLWAALPLASPLLGAAANMLFIFSAGCLALLFRSWRVEVSREALMLVVLCALLVGGLHLVAQRMEGSYVMRLMVTSAAGIIFSVWELIELIRRSRKDPEPLLKLIMAVVLFQKVLAITALVTTLHFSSDTQRFLTDNTTQSVYFTWCVLSVHLIVYLIRAAICIAKRCCISTLRSPKSQR